MRRWTCREAFSYLPPWRDGAQSLLKINHLLQICCTSKALGTGKQIHQQIVVHGSEIDPFMTTKLIQMYADCDELSSAQPLFHKLSKPNVFAWTAILAFYSRSGMPMDCLTNFRRMKLTGVVPDSYVFPNVLRACCQSLSFQIGTGVHKDVIVNGCEANLYVGNSLIDMYSKCGDVKSAHQVFDEMLERDLLSWNSMISGCVRNGLYGEGIEVMKLMRVEGFEPDLVTWNAVMDAYSRLGLCDEAVKIFKQIKEPNVISYTILICGVSRMGDHEHSLNIFRQMMSSGAVLPDVDCLCNICISCRYMKALNYGREVHAYGIKLHKGKMFYNSAGAALLIMYSKCGKIHHAMHVFEVMDGSDVVTWNSMILGFIHVGLNYRAIKCFLQMRNTGTKHNHITVTTLLPICNLKPGKEIHSHVIRNHFYSFTMVLNAVIHMYSRNGSLQVAYSLFSCMMSRDLVSWNTMIGGYGMHGLAGAALELLHQMKNSGFSPNHVTFTSLLSACAHAGMVHECLELFRSMTREYGLVPTSEHYSCIVDSLARSGRVEDAIDVVSRMPVDPDKSIWGILLAASRVQRNFVVGKVASDFLFHLEPDHAGNYVGLSNMYANDGNWDYALSVRNVMEDRNLVKPSAYSCV